MEEQGRAARSNIVKRSIYFDEQHSQRERKTKLRKAECRGRMGGTRGPVQHSQRERKNKKQKLRAQKKQKKLRKAETAHLGK